MSLLDFLNSISEGKAAEQCFYERWKIIQEKVAYQNIDEYYTVENQRKNHIIESKCHKNIAVTQTIGSQLSTELD